MPPSRLQSRAENPSQTTIPLYHQCSPETFEEGLRNSSKERSAKELGVSRPDLRPFGGTLEVFITSASPDHRKSSWLVAGGAGKRFYWNSRVQFSLRATRVAPLLRRSTEWPPLPRGVEKRRNEGRSRRRVPRATPGVAYIPPRSRALKNMHAYARMTDHRCDQPQRRH